MTAWAGISAEQGWRADTYNLLATLLHKPAEENLLEMLRNLDFAEDPVGTQPLAQAWRGLAVAARETRSEALRAEYQQLFIGMSRGEIVPYASWYLTGFLMEKPLARIRSDLRALGLKRHDRVREPEDHIAALFEVMTLLIRRNDRQQNPFFEQHIAPWALRLFQDLRAAPHAVFYGAVADLGCEFMHLEQNLLSFTE
ncbi:MAG: TorD/DmsD family molecular chaperone [Gammaproteobacteria bacterium]